MGAGDLPRDGARVDLPLDPRTAREGGPRPLMRLSVIGLGKLGICTAACFAAKGFDVVGVDLDRDVVAAVNAARATVFEPGLQELLTAARSRLCASPDYREAIRESNVTFLIVPTPSMEDGRFSSRFLEDRSEEHTSELQSQSNLVCRLLLEKKK